MKKAYKYRIYPTKNQAQLLIEQLALCADLYNAALQERRDAYKLCGKSISFTQQSAQLPAIKAIRPEYEAIYSQVLQDVLHRVDKAFQAFFHRVKAARGSPERAKRRQVVARLHERIRGPRENFIQQESRRLVDRFGPIVVEALVVCNLVKRPSPKQDEETGRYVQNGASSKSGLNKSIVDAAWSAFFSALLSKRDRDQNASLNILRTALGRQGVVLGT